MSIRKPATGNIMALCPAWVWVCWGGGGGGGGGREADGTVLSTVLQGLCQGGRLHFHPPREGFVHNGELVLDKTWN